MTDLVLLAALLFWLSGICVGVGLRQREIDRLEARWRSVFPPVDERP